MNKLFKRAYFSILFLTAYSVYAQDSTLQLQSHLAYLDNAPTLLPIEGDAANQIVLDGVGRLNSNSLPLGVITGILNGGSIASSTKNIVKNFPGRRLAEFEYGGGISYKHLFKKSDLTLHLGYQYRNMFWTDVTKDAINLLAYGNKMYEDKVANLSNMRLESVQYNQYSIGLGKKEQNLYASVRLSFLVGITDFQFQSKEGSLYTAPYGEYLDFRYNFRYNQSNSGTPNFFKPRGYGFSGDVHFAYQFPKGILQFDIKDLGVISWQNESFNYIKDTSFRFEGVYVINDLIKVNEYKFQLSGDTLVKDLISSKTNYRYNTNLPATFQLTYSFFQNIGKTPVQINCGIQARLLSNYYAMIYAKANFFLPKKFITSVMLSGGGYSLFNLGWDVGYNGKHFQALLSTQNLIGLVAYKHYPTVSLGLRVGYRF